MKEEEVWIKGKKIFYRSSGSGPLVIFLHGFAEDSNVWKHQFEIAENFQLVFPDLPGSGKSNLQDDMSMEGLAETIYELIKYLDKENSNHSKQIKPIIIGHSMGGYVALAFAEKYAHLLNAFGLFHSTAFADTEEKKQMREKSITFIENNGVEPFLRTTSPNLYSSKTKSDNQVIIEKQISHNCNFSSEILVYYYRAIMNRPDNTLILKNSTIPVLFVMGKHDQSVPLSDSLRQCHLPDFAYIYMLDQSAHMGMLEQPDKTNEILSAFLNSIYYQTQ